MREHCPDIPCILIANKIDGNHLNNLISIVFEVALICLADRSVTNKQFKFATQYNLPFYFVSAADGTNVVKIFQEALHLALDNKLNPPNSLDKAVDDLLNDVKIFKNQIC